MRNAYGAPARPEGEPQRTSFVCACCGRTIVTAVDGLYYNAAVGSQRRFCDPACRQAAWRRRRAGASEDVPILRKGGRSRRLAQGGDAAT